MSTRTYWFYVELRNEKPNKYFRTILSNNSKEFH